jgi:hypothetical protein
MAGFDFYTLYFGWFALVYFVFQQFPATWKSWLVAFVLTFPFYFGAVALLIRGSPQADGGFSLFGYAVLPMVVGNLTRAASLGLQRRGWSRRKALIVDVAGLIALIALFYIAREFLLDTAVRQTGPAPDPS